MRHDSATPSFSGPAPDALRREANGLVREFATGRPTVADTDMIRRWRAQSAAHERAWKAACVEWRKLGVVARAFDASRPAPVRPRAPRMGRRAFFGAAASAAGALGVVAALRPPLGLWPSLSEWGADYRTGVGEQRELALDADTRLSLNTRTSVALRGGGERPRIELIAGEAALSVRAGRGSCEIVAGSGRIDVPEGEIEVRRLDGARTRVTCSAGRARLLHPGGSVDLRPDQQVVYDDQAVQPIARPGPAASAWRQGVVVFQDLPLDAVVDEINRYRPGRVVLMNAALARHRLSARFAIPALDEAIAHIQRMYQADVRRVGNVVFIT